MMKSLINKKWQILAALALLAPVAGYHNIFRPLPTSGIEARLSPSEPAGAKPTVSVSLSKPPAPLSGEEYVIIGEKRFEILEPWRGHRIQGREPEELVMLPVELVLENRKIYVTAETRDAFVRMAAAAANDGIELMIDSGYRSAAYQRRIYQRKMAEGKDFYDIARGVAPPGYSEHMLGTTLDLVPSKWSFNGTPAEQWLIKNAAGFLFAQSYPEKSELGFTWEPWHWKFVGGG